MKLEDMLSFGNILRSAGLGLALTGSIVDNVDASEPVTVVVKEDKEGQRQEILQEAVDYFNTAKRFYGEGDISTAHDFIGRAKQTYAMARTPMPKDAKRLFSLANFKWADQLLKNWPNSDWREIANSLKSALEEGDPDYIVIEGDDKYNLRIRIDSRIIPPEGWGLFGKYDFKKMAQLVINSGDQEAVSYMSGKMRDWQKEMYGLK